MTPEEEFRFCAALALADGVLSRPELDALLHLATESGLPRARAAELLREQAQDPRLPTLPADPGVRRALLRRLERLAGVDGLDAKELVLVRHLWESARRLDGPATSRLVGPYLLLERLGEGATAVVHRARHTLLDVDVALKLLRWDPGRQPARERFLREARLTARLRHSGIVSVIDAGVGDEALFLVMELVQGAVSWEQLLERHGPASPLQAAQALAEASRALAYAHAHGVVHRDMKPGNLLRDAQGRTRILDFGIAWSRTGDGRPGGEGGLRGTPAYMAPEQALGSGVDPRTDVYGLGATLYALLCGQPPHQGEDLVELLARVVSAPPRRPSRLGPVPAPLEAITLRCLEKDPAARFRGALDVAEALEGWLARQRQGPVVAPTPAPWREQFLLARGEEERTAACRVGAEAGDAGAMNQLGFRLFKGLGCARDPVEAARWGTQAAELGHAEAMYGLGLLHETGQGVPRDLARACEWYRRAALAGDTLAVTRLARLEGADRGS